MKYAFGDIVVVHDELIGVVVKCWTADVTNYDVYVSANNTIENFLEDDVERYMVRHKVLSEEEKRYQNNALSG